MQKHYGISSNEEYTTERKPNTKAQKASHPSIMHTKKETIIAIPPTQTHSLFIRQNQNDQGQQGLNISILSILSEGLHHRRLLGVDDLLPDHLTFTTG
jgi:hypothetical protein